MRQKAREQARRRWEVGKRWTDGPVPTTRTIVSLMVFNGFLWLLLGGLETLNTVLACRRDGCSTTMWAIGFSLTPFSLVYGALSGYRRTRAQQLFMLEFEALGGVVVPPEPFDKLENGRAVTLLGLVVAAGTFLVSLVGGAPLAARVSGIATVVLAAALVIVARAKRRRADHQPR